MMVAILVVCNCVVIAVTRQSSRENKINVLMPLSFARAKPVQMDALYFIVICAVPFDELCFLSE